MFQQMIGIPTGAKCAPLLVDLFLHSYEPDFLQKNKSRKLDKFFNSCLLYILWKYFYSLAFIWLVSTKCVDPWVPILVVSSTTGNRQWKHCISVDFRGLSETRKLEPTFNNDFTVYDYQSQNNSWYLILHSIYPNDLEVRDAPDTQKPFSYFD